MVLGLLIVMLSPAVARAVGSQASVAVTHGLSSHGQDQSTGSVVVMAGLNYCKLLHSMWNLSGPKIEPVSPALQSRSLIIGPPWKPLGVPLST